MLPNISEIKEPSNNGFLLLYKYVYICVCMGEVPINENKRSKDLNNPMTI